MVDGAAGFPAPDWDVADLVRDRPADVLRWAALRSEEVDRVDAHEDATDRGGDDGVVGWAADAVGELDLGRVGHRVEGVAHVEEGLGGGEGDQRGARVLRPGRARDPEAGDAVGE